MMWYLIEGQIQGCSVSAKLELKLELKLTVSKKLLRLPLQMYSVQQHL